LHRRAANDETHVPSPRAFSQEHAMSPRERKWRESKESEYLTVPLTSRKASKAQDDPAWKRGTAHNLALSREDGRWRCEDCGYVLGTGGGTQPPCKQTKRDKNDATKKRVNARKLPAPDARKDSARRTAPAKEKQAAILLERREQRNMPTSKEGRSARNQNKTTAPASSQQKAPSGQQHLF